MITESELEERLRSAAAAWSPDPRLPDVAPTVAVHENGRRTAAALAAVAAVAAVVVVLVLVRSPAPHGRSGPAASDSPSASRSSTPTATQAQAVKDYDGPPSNLPIFVLAPNKRPYDLYGAGWTDTAQLAITTAGSGSCPPVVDRLTVVADQHVRADSRTYHEPCTDDLKRHTTLLRLPDGIAYTTALVIDYHGASVTIPAFSIEEPRVIEQTHTQDLGSMLLEPPKPGDEALVRMSPQGAWLTSMGKSVKTGDRPATVRLLRLTDHVTQGKKPNGSVGLLAVERLVWWVQVQDVPAVCKGPGGACDHAFPSSPMVSIFDAQTGQGVEGVHGPAFPLP